MFLSFLFSVLSEEDLADLKIMRLGFQNIGPYVTNLDMFIGVETIILSGNQITEILPVSFAANVNL